MVVTHHLNEIPPDIDRVILLRKGEVFADGPKAEVLTETNLESTYGVPLRLETINGYYVACPR